MSTGARAVLLSRACNNRCIFCAQEGLAEPARIDLDAELRSVRAASDSVTFVGGEPTQDARLSQAVAIAGDLGFRTIALQTNGAKLSIELARSLARSGLTDVHLSIHGAEARVHDYHTGNPGSFDVAALALGAARGAGLRVVVTTVATRSSFRSLSALPSWLAARGVAAWMLAFARHAGRAAEAADRVVPRLGLAVPFALHALETATAAGLPTLVAGVPACLLGPFASRAAPEPPRAFAEACAACDARRGCAGVDAEYLARFGGDELAPTAVVAREASVDALAGLFAGPGELAHPSGSPDRAVSKRSLPVLGRVQPAHAEASPGASRRTGEALREILPALFEREKE
jgi:radical SAM family protein